jgi:hypothetical protein
METLPKRWYKKKRYIIPLAALGLFTFAAANNNTPVTPQPAAVSAVVVQPQQQVAPTTQPASQETKTQVVAPASAPAPTQTQSSNEQLSNDNHYINSAGNEVHSPAYAPAIPPGASAQCRDGTYSFSQSRRGTCSHHGGVAEWF